MQWQLLLKEYGPELKYIKGTDNIVADALSCLELNKPTNTEEIFVFQHGYGQYTREHMAECFAADDNDVTDSYPLSYHQIHLEQQRDDALKDYIDKHSDAYRTESFKHGDKSWLRGGGHVTSLEGSARPHA
jgi:hypothetical protein